MLKVIEDGSPTFQQCTAVARWLYPLRAAVEETNAEGFFEIGDSFGNRRLGDRQIRSGLSHATGFRDGKQDVKVSELETAPDAIRPLLSHGSSPSGYEVSKQSNYSIMTLSASLFAVDPTTARDPNEAPEEKPLKTWERNLSCPFRDFRKRYT